MNRITVLPLSVALLLTIWLPGGAQQVQISSKPNPQIEKILGEISAANIEVGMRKLVGFGTRHTLSSQDDPARGIGAAWRWIKEEMDRYSRESGGRLIVTTDEFIQQPTQRVPQATNSSTSSPRSPARNPNRKTASTSSAGITTPASARRG